jgi:hypothetical protein
MAADALKVSPEGGLMAGRIAPQGIGLFGTPSFSGIAEKFHSGPIVGGPS